jgi:CO/xanthine dehydrogenase Mo-binding subunit
MAHLTDARARAVLQAVTAAAGWQQPKAPAPAAGIERGRGLALARYKNSAAYCAVVAEVEVADRIVLDRIWVAVDAGEVVNPDGLVNQIEGGVLQAASWTLKEAVQWDARGATTRTWADYPILNFDEAPSAVHVEVLSHPDLPPLGVGECAAGPTAGAIANALTDALGMRLRHLPLTSERLLAAAHGGSP